MADQASTSTKSTQNFVPIKEIREGVVIRKDYTMCAVLMASSINLALKSADEQKSVLMQFQNFLNSIDFTVQFIIQSRELDIRPYIALMEEQYKNQENDLMKIQTREYISFIKDFTENTNIMTKSFFVVVPYTTSVVSTTKDSGVTGSLKALLGSKSSKTISQEVFEESRSQLEQRVVVVEQGLTRTGVRLAQLGTEELIELYYKIFNPGDLEKPMQAAKK